MSSRLLAYELSCRLRSLSNFSCGSVDRLASHQRDVATALHGNRASAKALTLDRQRRRHMTKDNTHWLSLDSRVCVVTGAAGGIGRAIGETFAAAGARLALLDRDEAGCHDAAQALRICGIEAIAIVCDISDPSSVNQAAAQVERK